MLSFRRVFLIAPTLLCLAIEPAVAQYNVFTSGSVAYTDVIINGQPETLESVQAFEQRCRTRAAAGQWWMDENGNSGAVGGPATYNVATCQSLTADSGSRGSQRSQGSCTFFSGGSICSGPGWRTVN